MDLATSFRFVNPGARVYAGMGALGQLYREVQRLGAKRAFVVTSPTVASRTNMLERTREALGDLYAGVYDGATRESLVPTVEAGVEAARAAQADVIVAVGGGSVVGTARAITIVLAEGGSFNDLSTKHIPGQPLVSPRLDKPKLPNILVLTTPTTAADRGGAAVRDDKRPYRLELYDPKTRPVAIILDGEALLTAPLSLILDTCALTFTGVLKRFLSSGLNAYSYADTRQAVELSLAYMPQLVARPDDSDPRIQLAVAALIANRAFDAPGGGDRRGSNALYLQLRFRFDHVGMGAASSAMILSEMRNDRESTAEGQARLAEVLGVKEKGMSDTQAADAASKALGEFLESVGLPTRLRDIPIPEADLQTIAEEEAAEPSVDAGLDRMTDVGELVGILREAW